MGNVIGGDVTAKADDGSAKIDGGQSRPKKGALVEDETLVGKEDGGVETRQPDGKIEEGATDARENRK